MTRPTPAPTSIALTRLVSDGGEERLRNGDGTVHNSGRRSRRNRRDPAASTRGSGCQYFSIEDVVDAMNEMSPPFQIHLNVMLADVRWREWLAMKQTKHAVIVCWLSGPVFNTCIKVGRWIG